jgi:hypothetical protein
VTRYYIASGLDNVEQVKRVKARLDAAGWEHTYDWTVHGSVQREGIDRLTEVASDESIGVFEADIFIGVLPGGRGTHTELGMAIGKLDALACMALRGLVDFTYDIAKMVCLYSPDPDKDFSTSAGTTCAFYFHPYVRRFTDLDAMIDLLICEASGKGAVS